MFFISMPRDFKVGDTADCRINKKRASVTWRDTDHLIIEPGDVRVIMAVDKEGELIRFFCGDVGTTARDYEVDASEQLGGGFIVSGPKTRSNKLYWWIAINGPSCARSNFPMRNPLVTPTPEQLIGFPTAKEAEEAQHICLTAPMKEVEKHMKNWAIEVRLGRLAYIRPSNPEPPTRGITMWLDENRP